MKSLTRYELARVIRDRFHCGLPEARDVVNDLLAVMAGALADNRKVELRGFGSLEPIIRRARIGRNPKKPQAGPVMVPQRRVVRFRVFRDLHQEMNP